MGNPKEQRALDCLRTVPDKLTRQLLDGKPIKAWDSGGADDAETFTRDPGAPNGTDPARAVYSRHVAASASIALYQALCAEASQLSCKVEVIPGGVKELPRTVFKSVLNYHGDFAMCRDATRATMEVDSIADVVKVVESLLASDSIIILRTKDRLQPSYDSRPIGGYRDFQALCAFKHNGKWVFCEVQINLAAMVIIKGRKGGGHDVFKFARSIAAYTESTYSWTGAASEELCEKIENGMLVAIDLQGDATLAETPALLDRFVAALTNARCRVSSLK